MMGIFASASPKRPSHRATARRVIRSGQEAADTGLGHGFGLCTLCVVCV